MARSKPEPGRMVKTSVPGIYKRNGSYVVRVYNSAKGRGGRDDYTAETWEEAKELKRQKDSERKGNGRAVKYTVRQWMGDPKKDIKGRWFELYPRPREQTDAHNAERVSMFVREHGDKRLQEITPEIALDFNRDHPGRALVLRACFTNAIQAKQVTENPFDAVKVEKREGRQNITVLTDAELAKLIATAALVHGQFGQEVFGPMIAVAAGTGCRPGENFAITRDDIDFETGELHIWRQWNGRLRKFTILKGTKLDRQVVMLPVAVRALEQMDLPETGTIWSTPREKMFKFRELYYYWPAVRSAFVASLPASHHLQRRVRKEVPGGLLDFYEARHYFGTTLARHGCSLMEIEDQMGHQDSKTLRTYLHLTNQDVRKSVHAKLRAA